MNYLLEYKNYFKEGDCVLIEYWYNNMITPVRIVEKIKRRYRISHDCEDSKIKNAPDEIINSRDIIDHYRKKIN